MKRIAVIVLSVILCGTILSYFFRDTSGEFIVWAALPLLLVLLVIDRQKDPFSELIRPHTFFMSSFICIIIGLYTLYMSLLFSSNILTSI